MWICPICDAGNTSSIGLQSITDLHENDLDLTNSFEVLNPDCSSVSTTGSVQHVSVSSRQRPKPVPGSKTAHKNQISLVSININGIRGKKLDLQAFLTIRVRS